MLSRSVLPRVASRLGLGLHKRANGPPARCSALATKRKSHYEVLGVAETATESEIRTAYRSLAKSWHPDVSDEDDSEEVFMAINAAYAVLSDPGERGAYDNVWRYCQEQLNADDLGRPLTQEEMERAAALDKLEAAHQEAERARRMAKEARRSRERAKKAAALQ
ncbi:Chaperone protein DnaJ, partial [Tetrabaena socialis]